MADSFKITGEAGPQLKAGFNVASFRPELTIGMFSGHLSSTGTGNLELGVKSPHPGNLYYGEAGISFGKFKFGAALDSVTEGISTRDGPFQRIDEGFFGRTQVTPWKSDVGKVGIHGQVFFGFRAEWDVYKFLKAFDDAFDP